MGSCDHSLQLCILYQNCVYCIQKSCCILLLLALSSLGWLLVSCLVAWELEQIASTMICMCLQGSSPNANNNDVFFLNDSGCDVHCGHSDQFPYHLCEC